MSIAPNTPPQGNTERYIQNWTERSKIFLLYRIEDKVVGSLEIHGDLAQVDNYMVIEGLYVVDGYRKLGIGKLLLLQAEQLIIEEYCMESSVLYVDKGSWMQRWYERQGYGIYEEKDGRQAWMIKYKFDD